jgi:Helix-turn-helix domain
MVQRMEWLSTEQAARELGLVSARWVRRQIDAGRLRARVLATSEHVTYRIARSDLEAFAKLYLRDTWDPDWRDEHA